MVFDSIPDFYLHVLIFFFSNDTFFQSLTPFQQEDFLWRPLIFGKSGLKKMKRCLFLGAIDCKEKNLSYANFLSTFLIAVSP